MIRELLARLRFLIRRRTHEELDEELQFHFDQQVEVNVAAGMIAEEARRQAAIAFGGFERAREECREQRPSYWVETFFQDARYALRGFRRNPTFTATIVLTLMLGIGAPTAVFSIADRILFRPLPYGHAERLVSVGLVAPIEPQEFMLGGSYYEWKDHQSPFASLTSETGVTACDLTEHSPVRLSCAGVEANFLPTLGVSPVVGGNFEAAEDTPNGAKVALISYGLWLTRFNRDPAAVGKLMQIDGHPVRIVGVLPREFEMPRLQAADVLLPQALDEALQRRSNPGRPMWAFGRLKDGVSIEQAKAQLEPMFQLSLGQAPPQFRKEVHLRVRSLRDRQVHDAILAAWVLFGLALAVLLLACANVTSLLLARGAARERELAVRSALGASRLRLARQGLTESLALSLAGGGLGCLFAELLLRGFRVLAPAGMQFMDKARIDLRILTFSLVVSILCAGIFGFAPGLHRPRGEALSGRNKVSSSQAVLRQWLVVAQIAISMVLLAGGALLARSFANLQQQGLGMNPERIVTARISLGARSYPTEGSEMALFQRLERNLGSEESKMAFFERLGQTLRYGPGIGAVAMSDSVPPGGDHHDHIYAAMSAEGRPKLASGTGGTVAWRWVTPEYFRALDIPILQGTGFSDDELTSNEHFLVLSKLLADRMFPGLDPVGRRVRPPFGGPEAQAPWYTVVGVAANVKNSGLTGDEEPEYYRLRRKRAEDWHDDAVAIIKTNLPADVTETWIRSQVAALDPTIPVEIATLSEQVSRLADQPRFETLLVSLFAATGLLLAMVGLYGVISFLVAQRTQEIGVRIAVGATRGDILRLFLRSGFRLILPGLAIGLASGFAASRLFSSLLFGVGPHDPAVFVSVGGLLFFVALAATAIPAAGATRVDPTVALRAE